MLAAFVVIATQCCLAACNIPDADPLRRQLEYVEQQRGAGRNRGVKVTPSDMVDAGNTAYGDGDL